MGHQKHKRVIPDAAFMWITAVVFFGGTIIALATGAYLSHIITTENLGWTPAISAALTWVAIYCFLGFKIVDNQDYAVIERFGEFNRIIHSGPRILCFPGLIDKIAAQGSLRYQEMPLFKDEPGYKVDFKDGSTAIEMRAFYRIGPYEEDDAEQTDEAIYRFTYSMEGESEVKERIEEVLESSVIPRLQQLSIGDALVQKDTVAGEVVRDLQVIEALKAVGVELSPLKGLIIPDIALPEEILKQRMKKLEGEAEADKQSAQGHGYARTIKAVMDDLGISFDEARSVYENQRGLETLAAVQANVSFVAPNIKGVQQTMGIGDAAPRHKRSSS